MHHEWEEEQFRHHRRGQWQIWVRYPIRERNYPNRKRSVSVCEAAYCLKAELDVPGSEEMLPRVCTSGPDTGESGKSSGKENSSSSSEPVVQGGGEPATDNRTAKVRGTVDETCEYTWVNWRNCRSKSKVKLTEKPFVLASVGSSFRSVQTELRCPEQVGSVGDLRRASRSQILFEQFV